MSFLRLGFLISEAVGVPGIAGREIVVANLARQGKPAPSSTITEIGKRFKRYPIGTFPIDLAEVRTEEGKLRLFVAIGRGSQVRLCPSRRERRPRGKPRNSSGT